MIDLNNITSLQKRTLGRIRMKKLHYGKSQFTAAELVRGGSAFGYDSFSIASTLTSLVHRGFLNNPSSMYENETRNYSLTSECVELLVLVDQAIGAQT